jgi:2-aminoadipate transaminase
MAGLLGLNRATVSAAYSLLETEGLIQGHVGRGSFVIGEDGVRPAALDWERLLEGAPRLPAAHPPAPVGTISFSSSSPAADLFPLEEFRAACREVMESASVPAVLQLGSPAGYAPLRDYLLREGRAQGWVCPDDDLLVTNGCQQGLDLVARVCVRRGDAVLVEDPIYPGVAHLLVRAGARVVGVPVGEEGVDVEAFGLAMEREQPRLVVVTPSFHNPTGATMPLEARRAVLRRAREAGAVVVENDSYGELRYHGAPLPPLKQLDESGGTVLLRSFSKVAFPGLRVGWVTGPRPLVSRLVEAKQLADLHTDQLSQAVLLRFAESGRLAAHRARVVEAGRERLRAALAACQEHLPGGARFTRPNGGMNLWVRLPAPLDSAELLAEAEREGVIYAPGRLFEVSRREPGGLRLSFAGLDPERIGRGIEILGRVFSKALERARAAERTEPAPAMV